VRGTTALWPAFSDDNHRRCLHYHGPAVGLCGIPVSPLFSMRALLPSRSQHIQGYKKAAAAPVLNNTRRAALQAPPLAGIVTISSVSPGPWVHKLPSSLLPTSSGDKTCASVRQDDGALRTDPKGQVPWKAPCQTRRRVYPVQAPRRHHRRHLSRGRQDEDD
jgi:hypothetical protein